MVDSFTFNLKPFKKTFCSLLVFCLTVSPVYAEIDLANVENGEVSIQHEGNEYNINASENAIANFNKFDVAVGETVRFNLPGANSAMLNRITGGEASDILGLLFSNGNILFINPNGIHIGPDAQVQVQGIVASTLNITNADFLAGNYELARNLSAEAAKIVNEGNIHAADGGFIVLAGSAVENLGKLTANGGAAILTAGDKVTLSLEGDNLVSVVVNEGVKGPVLDSKGNEVKDLIAQAGQIQADGGLVVVSAKASEDIFDHVVNNTGLIQAQSVQNLNGRIILGGGDLGTVRVSGTVDATGKDAGEQGGLIAVYGDKIGVVEHALLDVSGANGGGTVLLGADYKGSNAEHPASITAVSANSQIKANATESGDGGKVVVWSEDATRYYGNISAQGAGDGKGGFTEVSSKDNLLFKGNVDLSAPNGESGTLLLDPSALTITDEADGVGSMDDELTPGSDAELLSSVPDDPVFNSVSRGQLEAFGSDANIILETNGLLRVRDMAGDAINLKATTGSLTLRSQSLTFNDLNDVIRTEGGAITVETLISQGKITAGGFDTTGLLGDKSGSITLSANTDISVQNIKTGGGNFTANADFDAAGQPGTFTINNGGQVSTAGGDALITGFDVNLAGTLNAGTGGVSLLRSKAGINGSPATIGIGNATGSFTVSGDELSHITASKVAIGNATNDDVTVDGVNAAQTQNIGELEINATRANRNVTFQNGASTFKGLDVNAANDINVNAAVTANGKANLVANGQIDLTQGNLTTSGDTNVHADADGNGHGDLVMTTAAGIISFINTNNHALSIIANDLQRSFGAYFNSGTGTMSFASSDGGQIQVGDATGDFTIRGDELQKITAGDLIIGDSLTSQIVFNGVQSTSLTGIAGKITVQAKATDGSILFNGNGSTFGKQLDLIANGNIDVEKNLNADNNLLLHADADASGAGDLILGAGLSLNSDSHPITILANDLQLGLGSHISSGNSDITIGVSDGGSIGLGLASGGMSVSNSELAVLKAHDVTFDAPLINVDGVTDTSLTDIAHNLILSADEASGVINFQTDASSFNFLTANAGSAINVNANVAMKTGDFKANADADSDGTGVFNIATGSEVSTLSNHGVEVTAATVTLNGNINTGRTGFVTLMPSLSSETIGLNDPAGTFNLTNAELNHIISTGPETPNVQVTVGRADGTGQIDIASTAQIGITPAYNLTLKGGNINFHNRLTLASGQSLTLDGAAVTGSGVRDVNFTGGIGTLYLNTTGSVTLQTLMDKLGKSSVGGDLNLFDSVSLNINGNGQGAIDVDGAMTLQSNSSITIDAPVTTDGLTTIYADFDRNGTGNFTLGTNGTITTNNHALSIYSNDITLTSGSFTDSGTADTSLAVTDGGNIAVGQGAASDYTLNQNEIKLVKAQNLNIGDNTGGNITVNGLTEANTDNVAGTITFNATKAGKTVSFSGGGSAFQNSVAANAADGVTLNKNLSTVNGTVTVNADTDKNGTGDLVIADNTSINSNSHAIDITANDINLNSTGVINSFKAPTTIHVSDAGTIRVGDGTGDMAISRSELSRIKAGDLTFGDAATKKIEVDNIQTADTTDIFQTVILKADDANGQVQFTNGASTFKKLTVEAGNGVQADAPLSVTQGDLNLIADQDSDGDGTLTATTAITDQNGLLHIKAADIDLQNGSSLTNAAGEILMESTAAGILGIGQPGAFSLDGPEVSKITANLLHLTTADQAQFGTITAPQSANIGGWLVEAAKGILVNGPVSLTGNFKGIADSDANGAGSFEISNTGSITTTGQTEIIAADADLQGAIQAASVILSPSLSSESIGLNDAQGSFNLSAAELNLINASVLSIGAAGGAGNLYIGSNGDFALAHPSSVTLRGGEALFSNTLTLADNATLNLQTGAISGTGDQDLVIGGTDGTLVLTTTGGADLATSIGKIGTSTVGGNLSIVNDKDLTATGKISTKAANGNVDLDLGTHSLTLLGLETGTGNIRLTGNEIDFTGGAESISGLGTLSLRPGDASLSIGVAGGAGDLDLSLTDLAAIHKNFSHINIGREDGYGAITINTVSFVDPVSFYSPAVGGSIAVNGQITGTDDASFSFYGSGGTTTLNAGISTSGDPIYIDDSVILGQDVAIASNNANVTITGTVNGAHNLTVKAGDGNILFNGAVGNTTPVGSGTGLALDLSTSDSKLTTFNSTVQANEGMKSTGPVVFKDNVTLGGTQSSFFKNNVTLDGLEFYGAGGVQFGDAESDRVILSGGPVSIATNNNAIDFYSRVNGAQDLTVNSGSANTNFRTDSGTENSLISNRIGDGTGYGLKILSTGTTTFERLNTNSGIYAEGPVVFHKNVNVGNGDTDTLFKDDVTLSGMTFNASNLGATFGDSSTDQVILANDQNFVNSDSGALVFNSKVTGPQNLLINAGTADTDFNAAVNVGSGTGTSLSFNGNSDGAIRFHSTLTTPSGIKSKALVEFMDDVTIGNGLATTVLNGDVILDGLTFISGGAINFGNNVVDKLTLSGGPVSILTNNDSNVTFWGSVDGGQNLSMNTGSGTTEFRSIVGGTTPVGAGDGTALNISSAGPVIFDGKLTANGGMIAGGPVTFKDSVALGAGDTAFHGTVDGAVDMTINAGTGNVDFDSAVGDVVQPNFIHIGSAKNVTFNKVQTSGDLLQSAGTGTTQFAGALAANGINVTNAAVSFNGAGHINSGAGAGAIVLTANNGKITGGTSSNDLTGASLVASATQGIGSLANPILTAVSNLEAYGGAGGVYITNAGALTIGGISGMVGVSALAGGIQILTQSPLTVNEAVTESGGGNITLGALGKTSAEDLTVNANITASGGNGNILIAAGNTLRILSGVFIAASQYGMIWLASGEDLTDGILNQDGNKGPAGGDIIMAGDSVVRTDNGNIVADAANNLALGLLNANANGDKIIGDVNTFSRAGKTTDQNGDGLNIVAKNLTMISKGDIGTKADPIELESKTKINNPEYTSFPGCTKKDCAQQRYVTDYKEPKVPKK